MRAFPSKFIWLAGVALSLAFFPQARSQGEETVRRGLTDFHHSEWGGLGAVFDIKQSPEGYLWLTTSKGVLRFDGVRFQSLKDVTGGAVNDGEIDSVFLGSSGGLWLPTEGGGLLLWKDGHLSNFPDRRCTPSRKQGQIIEDRDGSLWVQATAGLFRLRGSVCEEIGPDQGYPGEGPAAIFLDREGTTWVKPRTGPLLSLRRGESRFQTTQYGEGVSTGFAFLHEAPDGTIWLSDNQGLRRVTSKAGAPAALLPRQSFRKNVPFGDFTFAQDGSLWAVTQKGVRHFDHLERWPSPVVQETDAGESLTPDLGLSSDGVWKVLTDREGVWIATNSGLDQLRSTRLISVRLPNTQEHEFSIAAGDGGSVWTGNSTLPLTHVAPDGTTTSVPGTRQTTALRRDHTGTIWSAGAGDFHLWRSSGDRFVPLHYPDEDLDSVLFVAVDRNNDPWITTATGRAYHLKAGAWSNQTEALGKKPGIRGAMVDDKDGNVWFAFSNKVVRWDGSEFQRFSFPDGQRGVSENTMSVRGSHVWLGGAGGVQLFTQGKFSILQWRDPGLPGRVSGLVETEAGDLWINGFSGITHVSAAELSLWLRDPEYRVSAEHLDELDGLPGLSGEVLPEPSLVQAPDGKLWFATTKGIAWLDPVRFVKSRNNVPPPVIISAVRSDSHTLSGADDLRLPPPTDNVEIEYTALSLAIPERVLFRYKLDGVDEDWQNVGTRRQAYYTKLRPGNYRFHVIACNNDGVWNEAGAVLNFRVMPAYYQTLWFQALCVVAGAALLWFLHRLRLRQTTAKATLLYTERLAERMRIARDLHDTLLQSLAGLSLQLDGISKQVVQAGAPEKAVSMITHVRQQVDSAFREARSKVWNLRSPSLETQGLEGALRQLMERIGPSMTAHYDVTVNGDPRPCSPEVEEELLRIAQEAANNASQHAQASEIRIALDYGADSLVLTISDDGRGFNLEEGYRKTGHWGLKNMHERAAQVRGTCKITTEVGHGTRIEIHVPLSSRSLRNKLAKHAHSSSDR